MKTLATLYTMCLLAQLSSAQTSPEFQFTLYATDALGNRDSVILGYDPIATEDIDTFFGEVDITNVPYDSVFEMRAGSSFLEWNGIHQYVGNVSKTLLAEGGGIYCNSPLALMTVHALVMRVKHPPITFSWDPSLFAQAPQNDCRDWSLIVYESSFFSNPYFLNPIILQSYGNGMAIETLNRPFADYYKYPVNINNGSVDSVTVLYFVFSENQITSAVQESPNSAYTIKYSIQQGQLIIENEALSISKIMLYDVLGTSLSLSENRVLDVSGLVPGIYFAQIETDKSIQTIKIFLPGG